MRLAAYMAFFLVAVTSVQVRAQTSNTALARQLFEQGVELSDRQEWAQAADRFRRSFELRPSPIVAYNHGSALVELGRLVEASEAFRRAIRSQEAPEELVTAAEESLAEVEPRIGSLKVQVNGPREGVEVFVDDRLLPPQALGVRAPIDPGERRIRAVRGGDEIASTTIDIAEGAEEEITLELPPSVAAEGGESTGSSDPVFTRSTSSTASSDDGGGTSPWLWVGIGAGVLVAAAVAIILVVALSGGGVEDPVAGNLSPAVVEF